MDTCHVINLDSTIVNRLTSVVRRLCDVETQMKTLKTEFKDLKNEVTSLAETLITGSGANTDSCLSETKPEIVVKELTVTADNILLINTEEIGPISASEGTEEQFTSIITNISTPSTLEPEVIIDEQPLKRSKAAHATEGTTYEREKVNVKENIDMSEEIPVPGPEDAKDYVEVFACGESEDNGKPWGRAGLGVFFGIGSEMNCSQPIEGTRTTFNAASINACIQGLRLGIKYGIKKMKIYTDSEFTHNCITKWMAVWKKNNWKTFKGGKVKFRYELERLDELTCYFEGLKWILETDDIRIREAKNLAAIGVMKY